MLVEEIMTSEPRSVEVDQSVREALGTMLESDVRHLPVLNKGELVGILSDRDIRLFSTPPGDNTTYLDDIHASLGEEVGRIMQGDVLFVDRSAGVADVIQLMVDHRIGAVPVMDTREGALVGIVSYIDVLKAVQGMV